MNEIIVLLPKWSTTIIELTPSIRISPTRAGGKTGKPYRIFESDCKIEIAYRLR